jgi:DMSO/TMAO reductase YedYZ molybdopterin-dependent catalytic subunit
MINRRTWLSGLLATIGAAALSACDKVSQAPSTLTFLKVAEKWNRSVHRAILNRTALAPEFEAKDISPDFRANGTTQPLDPEYLLLLDRNFADYKLVVDGLVEHPLSLSLVDLQEQPSRTQITRHDCVEGWSSIGQWTGARLAPLLDKARLRPEAKYLVFHCLDTLEPGAKDNRNGRYYESIDLVDARHPQTILAYSMNGKPLGVPHGAPLRLRVERQLGYKQAKYIQRIEAVASLDGIGLGSGGFWPDRGYEWYAGI